MTELESRRTRCHYHCAPRRGHPTTTCLPTVGLLPKQTGFRYTLQTYTRERDKGAARAQVLGTKVRLGMELGSTPPCSAR